MALKTEAVVEFLARNADKVIKEFRDVEKAADKAGDGTKSAGNKASQGLEKWAMQAISVGAVSGTAMIAARELYQAIGEGAELTLARQRFDELAGSIGTTGDALLGKFADATNGMLSSAEMVDSASQIISTGLATNERDVVRLATVVSELGLDMGQVILTFANNSKMRLDSLGLAVSDVEARTDELVATGMSMDEAFDAAVLEGLEARLELVGSAADSTAGSIKATEAALTDASDAFKMQLAGNVAAELGLVADNARSTGDAMTLLAREAADALNVVAAMTPIVKQAGGQLQFLQLVMSWFEESDPAQAYEQRREGLQKITQATEEATDATDELTQALREAEEAGREEAQDQQWMNEVRERARLRAIEQAEAEDLLQLATLKQSEAVQEATDRIFEWSEAGQEAIDTAEYWRESSQALSRQMGGSFLGALEDGSDETINFTEVMLQAAAQNGATAESLGILAAATGEYDDDVIEAAINTAAMTTKAQQLGQAVAEGNITVNEALEAFRTFQAQLLEPYEMEVVAETDKALGDIEEVRVAADAAAGDRWLNFRVNTIGSMPVVTGSQATGIVEGANNARASGGPVTAGMPYIVGERGPEWFVPNQSGTVLPNGQHPAGGTTIINNNVQTMAQASAAGRLAVSMTPNG